MKRTLDPVPISALQLEPELLTKLQVAQLLAVSPRTIDNMKKQNRISFIKLTGKTIRFPRHAILQHIRQNLTVHAQGADLR